VEHAVIRIVPEHPDVGIAHQPVAHIDRRDQLAEHAPLAGHIRQSCNAFGDAAPPARSQPALAARRDEAIDRPLAIGLVFGGRALQDVIQLLTNRSLRRQPGQLEEQVVGDDQQIISIHARACDAERPKLLEQRRSVGVWLVDQVLSPCRRYKPNDGT